MVDLYKVATIFNNKIVSFRPDCYAVVEEGGFVLAVWLDGVPVVKMDAAQKINFLLKPGFKAYTVLKSCFPGER